MFAYSVLMEILVVGMYQVLLQCLRCFNAHHLIRISVNGMLVMLWQWALCLKIQNLTIMLAHNVSNWNINSRCSIEYMFDNCNIIDEYKPKNIKK